MSQAFPIPVDTRERNYTATAGQTVFAADFPFQQTADVKVYHRLAAGGPYELLEEAADYTLTGAGNPLGGAVTLTTGAAVGDKIRIRGEAVLARTSSVVQAGVFKSSTLDDELDRNRIIQQEQERDSNDAQAKLLRAMLTPDGETIGELPALADRKKKLMAFDADGNPTVAQAIDTTPEYPALEKRFDTVDELQELNRGLVGEGETVTVVEDGRGGRFLSWPDLMLPHDGGVVIRYSDGLPGGFVRLFTGDPWVEFWAGIASGLAIHASRNRAAFQAALNYCKGLANGGMVRIRAGVYVVDDELDLSTDANWRRVGIEGAGMYQSTILGRFLGAAKAIIKGTRPDALRCGGVVLKNLTVRANSSLVGIKPKCIEMRMAESPQLENVMLVSDYSNTAAHFTGGWNGVFSNVQIWNAGHFRPRKEVPDGVTFDGTAGGTTITASANHFDASDENTWFFAVQTTGRAGRHFIQTVNSPTSITVSEVLLDTYEDAYGWHEGVRGSMSAAGNTLTLDTDTLNDEHIGLTVLIRNGKNGILGTKAPLIAQITGVPAPNQATLSVSADVAITDQTVYFAPAFVCVNDTQAQGDMNDMAFRDVRVESFAGLAFAIQGTHFKASGLKAHGHGMLASGTYASAYGSELAQCAAVINPLIAQIEQIATESQVTDPYRIYLDGVASGVTIHSVLGALIERQKLMYVSNSNGWACVTLGTVHLTSDVNDATIAQTIVEHDYTCRLNITGPAPSFYGKQPNRAWATSGLSAISFSSHDDTPYYVEDDQVVAIPIPPAYLNAAATQRAGILALWANANINAAGFFNYVQNVASPFADIKVLSQPGTLFAVSTSALAGTTGTDGKVTVSLSGANGYIQVENRSGGTIRFGAAFLS